LRTEQEIFDLILSVAKADVQLPGKQGSYKEKFIILDMVYIQMHNKMTILAKE